MRYEGGQIPPDMWTRPCFYYARLLSHDNFITFNQDVKETLFILFNSIRHSIIQSYSPEYEMRFFQPWTTIVHTGWKVVFCKARYIRINKKFVSKEINYLNMEKMMFFDGPLCQPILTDFRDRARKTGWLPFWWPSFFLSYEVSNMITGLLNGQYDIF